MPAASTSHAPVSTNRKILPRSDAIIPPGLSGARGPHGPACGLRLPTG